MVLKSNAYDVREQRLRCESITVTVLESNGYSVRAYGLTHLFKQIEVIVVESNGHGVRE
jgi:hypothetical protein